MKRTQLKLLSKKAISGVVSIEFALMSAILFFVILLLIDMGVMVSRYLSFGEAARKGIRLAAVCDVNNPATLTSVINAMKKIEPSITSNDIKINYYTENGAPNCTSNCYFVDLTISNQKFEFTTPIGKKFFNVPPITNSIVRESLSSARSDAC